MQRARPPGLPWLLVSPGRQDRRRHCHCALGLRRSRWPGSPTRMNKISYSGYRFPPEIIHQAIWLYLRFTLSLRDVEDLLVERGVAVSYETVQRWVNHFGPIIAADLRKRRLKPHTTCWSGRPPTASMCQNEASRRGLSENRRPYGLS